MSRRPIVLFLAALFALVLTLTGAATASAQQPTPPPPLVDPPRTDLTVVPVWRPGVFTDPSWLTVDFHRVRATIENQVATTRIDMQFTNTGDGLAEGTFVFPLPDNAAVDRLTMFINGEAFDAKILSAQEARSIYDEIVRQYRDPALLEYVGRQALQANVFPIPPGESRRIQIDYTQLLPVENGLVEYVYPLTTTRLVQQLAISVEVLGDTPIAAVYSPSHNVAVSRESETRFRAGFEESAAVATQDFTLYYGVATDDISVSLLTFKETAGADGYFMLLVQPPLAVDTETVQPKDIVLVIDQSGSMSGQKWTQAQAAASYVLQKLNPQDRFNVVVFSTGFRQYASTLQPASQAADAAQWVNSLYAEGGTDINLAMLTALGMVDAERPTTILFMTDGVPSEGVTDTDSIIANARANARPNARVFTFGVGDDVNTILLDTIAQEFGGATAYVRPSQRIDEEMASLYTKISSPVLSDVVLDFGGVTTELLYPQRLTDLFAGEQLVLVGRYRRGAQDVTVSLSGRSRGESVRYSFDNLSFRENAGGEAFIARLWAQRRIAELLDEIRLRGENRELVDSIVNLSVRFGIITPYTSFLIEEDDILTQQGRRRAQDEAEANFGSMTSAESGAAAVDAAVDIQSMRSSSVVPAMAPLPTMTAPGSMGGGGFDAAPPVISPAYNPIQTVGDKTFIQLNGIWTDTTFDPDTMTTTPVVFLSDAYFDLLDELPALAPYFALGERVIVVLDGTAYEVTDGMATRLPLDDATTASGPLPALPAGAVAHVIESVEYRVMESFPMRVVLQVRGYQPDGCSAPVEVVQVRDGNNVSVQIYRRLPPDSMCPMMIVEYAEDIVLEEGFVFGQYHIDVNGVTLELKL
jgi:Ca-activated chloride channel family protein